MDEDWEVAITKEHSRLKSGNATTDNLSLNTGKLDTIMTDVVQEAQIAEHSDNDLPSDPFATLRKKDKDLPPHPITALRKNDNGVPQDAIAALRKRIKQHNIGTPNNPINIDEVVNDPSPKIDLAERLKLPASGFFSSSFASSRKFEDRWSWCRSSSSQWISQDLLHVVGYTGIESDLN